MEQNQKTVRQEAREKTVSFITAALGFVAGLAWNDFVQSVIQHFVKIDQNSLLAKFLYAGGITLLAVILIIYLEKINKDDSRS